MRMRAVAAMSHFISVAAAADPLPVPGRSIPVSPPSLPGFPAMPEQWPSPAVRLPLRAPGPEPPLPEFPALQESWTSRVPRGCRCLVRGRQCRRRYRDALRCRSRGRRRCSRRRFRHRHSMPLLPPGCRCPVRSPAGVAAVVAGILLQCRSSGRGQRSRCHCGAGSAVIAGISCIVGAIGDCGFRRGGRCRATAAVPPPVPLPSFPSPLLPPRLPVPGPGPGGCRHRCGDAVLPLPAAAAGSAAAVRGLRSIAGRRRQQNCAKGLANRLQPRLAPDLGPKFGLDNFEPQFFLVPRQSGQADLGVGPVTICLPPPTRPFILWQKQRVVRALRLICGSIRGMSVYSVQGFRHRTG